MSAPFCLLKKIRPADKPLLSPLTCKILIKRYDIPEPERFIFPIEREIMAERRRQQMDDHTQ
jgi:hypothetical protein